MTGNNRIQFVEREHISGHIEGVDFGYRMQVIARSPAFVLCWSSGTAYTSGRQTCYGESSMTVIPRDPRFRYHPDYRRIPPEGGRLTYRRIMEVKDKLHEFFPDDVLSIANAAQRRQTVLIEGGGPPLMPDIKRVGRAAWNEWASLPSKGLLGDAAARPAPDWMAPSRCFKSGRCHCDKRSRERCGNWRQF
jgi:hypothetical protein